jgi:hypothetical protein
MDEGVQSTRDAYALLTWAALDRLRQDSLFRDDDGMGCCHICCRSCSALHYLDRTGQLDAVLTTAPHQLTDLDGRGRRWMYRMWDGTGVVQRKCGHALPSPAVPAPET